MAIERALMLKGVQVNKISQAEYTARVKQGLITESMIEQQGWLDYAFTMEVQKNCEELKPVAMSGSYNDLTDTPDLSEFEPTTVLNTLESSSTESALAAAQGKVLNEKINMLDIKINELGTKKYLHRIRLSLVSSDHKTSAQVFCDFYSDSATPYTNFAFTTMSEYTDVIPVTGNINQITSSIEKTYAYQMSILNFNGGYAFIINGNVEIDTYSGYESEWSITDNVVGYIFA